MLMTYHVYCFILDITICYTLIHTNATLKLIFLKFSFVIFFRLLEYIFFNFIIMGKKNKSQSLMELTPVNNTTLKKKSKDRNMSGLSPAKNLVVTSPQKISPEKKKSKKKSPSPSKKVEKSSMKSPAKGKISTISRDRNTDESDLEDEDTFKPFAQVSKFNLPHDSDTEEEEEEEEQEDGLEAIEGFDTPNKKVAGSDKGNYFM